MGWFLTSSPSTQAPDRSQRQVCWDARDAYFVCLEAHKILAPGTEKSGDCVKERQVYEGNCAKSWIEYFNKRRVLQEEQKDQLTMAQAQADETARKRR